jgi:hypothetical protein
MGMSDHPPARAGESKCIVCGCTDSSACEEGCSWVSLAPPVCSSCVNAYLNARLWAALFAVESIGGAGKRITGEVMRMIDDLRRLYRMVPASNAGGIPTLKRVCQINRNADRWAQKQRTRGARK